MSEARGRAAPRIEVPRRHDVMDCGATLLIHRRPGAAVTAVRVHVRGGPGLDAEGKDGTAYLVGSLAEQGTDRHTDEEIASRLEPEGGGVHGDALGLSGAIAGPAWRELVDVLGELTTSASYPEDRVGRQLDRLKTRLAAEAEDPRAQSGIRFKSLIYGEDHFLGRNPYGTHETVSRITPQDLRTHREDHWCGARMIVSIAGDVDPDEVHEHADRAFRDVPLGTPHERTKRAFPPIEARRSTFERDRQQVHVHLGHLGVERRNPDYAALTVMDHVLGTGPGFTNRITRSLRDELGLAYSVHADIHGTAGLHPGMFRAYIGTSPENVCTAVDGFVSEMRRIQDEPVPEDELAVAKSYLVGSFAMGFERAARRASYLVNAEVHGFPDDHLEQLPARFAAVTPEDVQRAAQAHLYPDACSISVAGPPVDL
ncbi:MAG: pitrilysin family protein [Planctomycetota bacterium]